MPPPEAPPAPSVSVVVVVGGACVLRYSRSSPPPPPADPPAWGGRNWGDPGGGRGPPQIRRRDGDLVLLLRSLGPGAPPEPVAVTSFVGPEPCDLLPAAPPVDIDMEVGSTGGEPGYGLAWPQVSDQLLAINGAPTAGMTHAQALARIRGGGSRLRLLLRRSHGAPPNPSARGVLTLCVSSSPRGEPCFCLVGRRDPP
ncbi:PDZ domain-containing protein MAGIX isoform X3 [Haliaeetus albicilla]|uniref:PDZ domain-containing protein MAGIX isoform X3 n=1 Tax=Haliaeetus albicilla TaxID=8969 RepID=UPI0037E8F437